MSPIKISAFLFGLLCIFVGVILLPLYLQGVLTGSSKKLENSTTPSSNDRFIDWRMENSTTSSSNDGFMEKNNIPSMSPLKLSKIDCNGLATGVYPIVIPGLNLDSLPCNGDVDGGGWIVIQKRFDGSENFNRSWIDYRNGFGKKDGEFFIGLELIHRITKESSHQLYIQMEEFDKTCPFASYKYFRIGNESTMYELESLNEFNGTVNDEMLYNIKEKFSTYDRDNDGEQNINLALMYNGGWWHYKSQGPNLNGKYYTESVRETDSMSWNGIDSIKSVQMLIRPTF